MAKKTRKFKTEVQQLLDLVVHSLYSKKEIFLRELISNASDAIDRCRFESLTDSKLTDGDDAWEIRLDVDKEARTLRIFDNGIGMTTEEVEKNIGTIASSGTKAFVEKVASGKDGASVPELIGQFGVGFYSAFMVADKVELETKHAGGEAAAVRWVSSGAGSYSLEESNRSERGTQITLHLREGLEDFTEEWRLRSIVKQYSDYIEYPIVMDVERTEKPEEEGAEEVTKIETETLNSMKSIWKRSRNEVKQEEYNEFYHAISHDYSNPLKTIHFAAEGTTEFKALLFLPERVPFDLFFRDGKHGLHLYVRNVFIGDDFKALLPEYLRFVRGVVDSSDLPLNISREMLQDDAIIRRIRKSLVKKVLDALAEMKEQDNEKYLGFFRGFGKVIKEGLHSDFENKDKLQNLVLFPSTDDDSGKLTGLREYVERMPDSQKDIYYLTADSLETALQSPQLEAFKKRDYEVLLFVDPIDEWVAQSLTEYDGKTLKAIDRGTLDLDGEAESSEEDRKAEEEAYKPLLDTLGKTLDDEVKEVRLSSRLTDSACCLVADESGMNANMERIMRAMDQEVPESKRILEVNAHHPLMEKMKTMAETNPEDQQLQDYADLVFGQALLLEGSPVKNPLRFAKLVSQLMVD